MNAQGSQTRGAGFAAFAAFAATIGFASFAAAQAPSAELEAGAYLTRIAGCADCHTASPSEYMAGGAKVETPFGTFYGPNITPDVETGIGSWSEDEFRNALRLGVSLRRSWPWNVYYPAFPYRSYSKMSDEDVRLIYLYLRSIDPVRRRSRSHDLPLWVRAPTRASVRIWQDLFFRPRDVWPRPRDPIRTGQGPFQPRADRSPSWNRGAYLVEAFLHCSECHTPRSLFGIDTLLGGPDPDRWMGGSSIPMSPRSPPNVTSDETAATSRWSVDDWDRFLRSGRRPDRPAIGGEMAEVVQNTSALTRDDRAAVIEYLRSLPPVRTEDP